MREHLEALAVIADQLDAAAICLRGVAGRNQSLVDRGHQVKRRITRQRPLPPLTFALLSLHSSGAQRSPQWSTISGTSLVRYLAVEQLEWNDEPSEQDHAEHGRTLQERVLERAGYASTTPSMVERDLTTRRDICAAVIFAVSWHHQAKVAIHVGFPRSHLGARDRDLDLDLETALRLPNDWNMAVLDEQPPSTAR